MKNPDTGKPIPVFLEPSCTCALRPYPHVHAPEVREWLKRVWANDCSGDGYSPTQSTFPPLKGGD